MKQKKRHRAHASKELDKAVTNVKSGQGQWTTEAEKSWQTEVDKAMTVNKAWWKKVKAVLHIL